MKILHISPDDNGGGAAKAAYRLHHALRVGNIDSHMLVLKTSSADPNIHVVPRTFKIAIWNKVQKITGKLKKSITPAFSSQNPSLHSQGTESQRLVRLINQFDADIIHLHWINGMLSINDISNINKPIVWTLHDMWAFCGAEHYTPDLADARFKVGYKENNRPAHESGPDINKHTWERKFTAWQKPMQIVAPSNWMKKCVESSILMKHWPLTQIFNPIDTSYWRPLNKLECRKIKNLPIGKKLVAFGAMGGGQNFYKGFELLVSALEHLGYASLDLEIIVFGENRPNSPPNLGFPVHYTGHLNSENLRLIYNAADILLIPSRMDNLPNTGVEAMACAVPIVAFDIGGLGDIVTHQETGWLANAFNPKDLAKGILWVLENEQRYQKLSENARKKSLDHFSNEKISAKYLHTYQNFLLTS